MYNFAPIGILLFLAKLLLLFTLTTLVRIGGTCLGPAVGELIAEASGLSSRAVDEQSVIENKIMVHVV